MKTVFGKLFMKENTKKINGNYNIKVKNNIKEIAQENLFMYKRLRDKQPTYDIDKILKEYDKNQYYKQNACKYPSINFFKENKKSNILKKIYSSSIDSKKKQKLSTIFKNKVENFPKINNNTITTRFSTSSNTYTDFGFKKRGFKGRKKKKFENFTFNDLKMLKIKKNKSNLIFDLLRPSRTSVNLDSEINKNNYEKHNLYERNKKYNSSKKRDNNENKEDDDISDKDSDKKSEEKSEKDKDSLSKDKDYTDSDSDDDISEEKKDKKKSEDSDDDDSISDEDKNKSNSKNTSKDISENDSKSKSRSKSKKISKSNSKNNSKSNSKSISKSNSKYKSKSDTESNESEDENESKEIKDNNINKKE